jgi:hypothetical protein
LFLAADHLVIPSVKRSRFAALQLARLRPLVDPKNLCLRLWQANLFWTKKYLSLSEYPRQLMSLTSAKSVPLVNTSTILGDLWENFWRESQLLYMRPKITREVVNRQQIFFHPLKRE